MAADRTDVPIAIARDLGAAAGTNSWSVALAGTVVVGRTESPDGALGSFQHDLTDPDATMQKLDDRGFYPNLSSIVDADGSLVVGTQQAGTASTRAFVFDLSTQVPTQVPAVGMAAFASSIDRGVVVGGASTSDFRMHAFAYDFLGARDLLDLGTLGGRESEALDVSGSMVVGESDLAGGGFHAFSVDLLASGRPMTDLGSLGGTNSAATDVAGDLAVGWAEVPGGGRHAFVARVRGASSGSMADLGTLGGDTSHATGVDGPIVVGTSARVDGSVGIWWTDVRTAPYVLHDLGTQAGGRPGPVVVGGRVIGTRQTPVGERGFVLDTATGSVLELDPLPGHQHSSAVDLAGDAVAGTSYAAGAARATAWTLGTVPSPTVRLARRTTRASEGRRTRIVVVRSGDLRTTVDVRYRFTGTRGGATVRKDLRRTRGVVRLEPGRSAARIRVKVRDDRLREGVEKARLRIAVGTAGASTLGRTQAWLVIRASDRRRR